MKARRRVASRAAQKAVPSVHSRVDSKALWWDMQWAEPRELPWAEPMEHQMAEHWAQHWVAPKDEPKERQTVGWRALLSDGRKAAWKVYKWESW